MTHNTGMGLGRRRPLLRSAFCAALSAALVCGMSACTGDDPVSVPDKQAREGLWTFRNPEKTITLAIDETYQMSLTPMDVSGQPLADNIQLAYRSIDSTRAYVDANGLITGKAITAGVNVIASVTINGITYADTTLVAVTQARRALKSIQLVSGNAPVPTSLYLGATQLMQVRVLDSANAVVPGLVSSVSADNPSMLQLSTSGMRPYLIGKTKIRVRTMSYGILLTDSIEVFSYYPTSTTVYVITSDVGFSPAAFTIAKGGTVMFINNVSGSTARITFDQPNAVTGGNIDSLASFVSASRKFDVPGTYTFTNTASKRSGKVVVREQPQY